MLIRKAGNGFTARRGGQEGDAGEKRHRIGASDGKRFKIIIEKYKYILYNIIMNALDYTLIVFSALFGLAVGSFLNVCIYRIPKKVFFESKRSYCPECKAQLKWYHNIPLFSYIALKGKCAFCGAKISPRYPIVEFLNAALWVATYFVYGPSFQTLQIDLIISVLIVMSFIDFDTKEIPDGIHAVLIVLGIAGIFLCRSYGGGDILWWEKLIGALAVSVPMFVIALITGGIGGGDIKLYFALGLILGWKLILAAGLISVLLGGLGGVILMLMKKAGRKTEMPFGPYIAIASLVTLYFGEDLLSWYIGLMGF